MKKRLISLGVIIILAALIIVVALLNIPMKEKKVKEETTEDPIIESVYENDSIYLWYTDDTLTNYINGATVAYNEEHGTRIVPVLQSPTDYLENLNNTMNEYSKPDMFIISNDALGKVYLSGLGDEITLDESTFESSYLSQAKNAMSYKDKIIGYPLNFETTVLLYNRSYLRDMAITAINREKAENTDNSETSDTTVSAANTDVNSGENDVNSNDDPAYEEAIINNKILEIIPETIEDIKSIADNYDAPENVENFFVWDVNDIFYNYFFIGDAINVGGDSGWAKEKVDIYTEEAITAMKAYQSLNQFFSIDASETDYNHVIADFIEGKTVFTIATSDVVTTLENAKEDGTFLYDYGVALVPAMSETLDTRSMSETNAVVISPYANEHSKVANDFAYFMTTAYVPDLYTKSGKVSAARYVDYEYDAFYVFASEYEYSTPLPKMVETSNFWIDLERTFLEVWNGEDANEELKKLAEQILLQIKGEKVDLEYITIEDESEEIEYLDEEEYTKEAQNE